MSSKHGWPDNPASDNGPCLSANEFRKAMEDMTVYHITSIHHYHQFNGFAKNYVQLVKSLLTKARERDVSQQPVLMLY